MIYKSHLVELWVNGRKVEFESQESVNIRFNNILQDPTKISSTQADYSFEFELPCTPTNNKIFDYANSLSKLNKFRSRWNAELYADGTIIFKGSLTLNSVKNKMYHVNLVSVKNYSLEEIFGESVMTSIRLPNGEPWAIPFDGAGSTGHSIDYYNQLTNGEVYFPLISYGAFTKDPYSQDEVGSSYTSKFDFDQYNRWYVESFYPSLSMLETMKKAFEWKGYNVGGDAFNDYFLKDIFMSVNLADGQDPTYNLGNPKFGKVELAVGWDTPINTQAYTQQLKFPYARLGGGMDEQGKFANNQWNFDTIQVYDMLSEGIVNVSGSSYLYQPNEHVIVIPSDGFYKITLSGTSKINNSQTSFQANQWYQPYLSMGSVEIGEVEIPVSMRKHMPFEIQLVRNYDDNIELIKGENNFYLADGVPLHTTQCDAGYNTNYYSIYSSFPHEKCGSCFYYGDTAALHGSAGAWLYAPPTDITNYGDELSKGLYNFEVGNNMGYLFNDGDVMAYDPSVSPIFICGFTSMGNNNGGGCPSVMKNGYSWSSMVSEKSGAFYPQYGYWKANTTRRSDGVPTWNMTTVITRHNENSYNGSFNYYTSNDTAFNGQIQCMVKLNKGDRLQLFGVQREYTHNGDQVRYKITADYKLSIEAASPSSYDELVAKHFDYNSPTEFDVNLNLANFFNKEKKVSEWMQDVIDAFNFEVIQDGNNVMINTKKRNTFAKSAVDVDDRANASEAESSMIDYPRSMAVKYKIDDDEWGFERSAVEAAGGDESILDHDDWKKYGDSGYSEVMLNDDSYVTSKSEKSLKFSYSWYDNFKWYEVDSQGQQNPYANPVTLRIPVISKYTYMIDGYNYEESLKHDGYGLPQRFWIRPTKTNAYVWTESYPTERIDIYTVSNVKDGVNLSYKDTERSLLSEYFNIKAYLASNYVEIEVYLTSEEYNRLKNGALVHFDSDLYEVVNIDGYDPSGFNPTKLKLMKKVV